ncbi:MAG: 3-oxoacyl-[acyl-carrier-protein] reductase [Candidatus Cloacimonetes bacterium]|nr:3-oxoacyl-[acyl-carrier-protein] reductase [Candidatus Cloacimonadota bacterium]MCF7815114.1 3-oxoacyl-[acyl-carrier-protein] reductase [Candidatus Cloacimonadota bacterium]MCF7868607.1 3-oxoacyl-[acyl-carrier-protein] reductase [Candidatus Cloacimonadota bacterium]MCF7882836.1 3-oxoacyl-[acyl-carrier-protein] reductase [Candidatus Cloacimonadota bacterium]
MKRLEDKVAVITGSARGIGFSIAKEFAKNGAICVIIDLNQDDVDKAVQKIDDQGWRAVGFAGNVVKADEMAAIFKEIVAQFGQIDVLINNAGITRDGLIMKMKEQDWDAVLAVNLKGTFNCTQKVCRFMMKKRSGVILNIASVIGIMGNAGQANYAASKGGIIALTKSTAREFASRNIRVNAIAPGFIRTEMTDTLPEEVVKKYAAAIPLNRMGSPADVAKVCVFLASDEAEYITGQTINVDGGLIM